MKPAIVLLIALTTVFALGIYATTAPTLAERQIEVQGGQPRLVRLDDGTRCAVTVQGGIHCDWVRK